MLYKVAFNYLLMPITLCTGMRRPSRVHPTCCTLTAPSVANPNCMTIFRVGLTSGTVMILYP